MGFEKVFAQAKEQILKNGADGVREHLACQFNLTGKISGRFYIEVKDGNLNVEPYEYNDRHALFICSADTLSDLVSGKISLTGAMSSGRLRTEGSIEQALKLRKVLKANGPETVE